MTHSVDLSLMHPKGAEQSKVGNDDDRYSTPANVPP
jgi:hypothetical protein